MAGGKLNLGTLAYLLELDDDPFDKALKGSEAKAQKAGSGMTKGLTLPLVAVGAAAAKLSLDFESTFSQMQGLAGVTADEVDGLKKSVLGLAGETGKAPQELAEALYFIRSAGVTGAAAMEALEYSAKGAAAGLGSTVEVADAITSAMNAYGTEVLSAAEATDVLVNAAREGKAEPAELAKQFGRLLPVAAELGISFNDVGAGLAFLSRTSGDAALSATGLGAIMNKLLKPSQQGAELLAEYGMSAETVRKSIAEKGLLGTLTDLRARLEDSGFQILLEDSQAITAGLALTKNMGEDAKGVFDSLADSTGATDDAFGKFAETAGFKNAQAFSQMQAALIGIGDVLVPLMGDVAAFAARFLGAFNDLPDPVKTLVVAFGALLAALGPIISVASNVNKAISAVSGMFDKLATGAYSATGAISKMGPILATAGFVGAAVGVGMLAGELTKARVNAQEFATALATANDEQLKQAENMIRALDNFGQLDGMMKELAGTNQAGAVRMLEVAEAAGLSAERIDELRGIVESKAAADVQAAKDQDVNTAAMESGIPIVDEASLAWQQLTEDLSAYGDRLKSLFDPMFAVQDAMAKEAEARAKLNELTASGSATAGELSAAQRDLAEALIESDAAATNLEVAFRNGDVTLDQLKRTTDGWVESGRMSQAQADAFTRSLIGATNEGRALGRELVGLSRAWPISIHADTGPARAALAALISRVENSSATMMIAAKTAMPAKGQSRGGWAGTGPDIFGPTGTDIIPTYLSPGEFVIPADVAKRLGGGTLAALLRGGGGAPVAAFSAGGPGGGGVTYITIPLTVNGKLTMPELNELRTIVRQAIVEGERRSTKLPLRGR